MRAWPIGAAAIREALGGRSNLSAGITRPGSPLICLYSINNHRFDTAPLLMALTFSLFLFLSASLMRAPMESIYYAYLSGRDQPLWVFYKSEHDIGRFKAEGAKMLHRYSILFLQI